MYKLWRRQEGLSMVEALVALAILAIVSAPILGAFMVARAAQAESTNRAIAQGLARDALEQVQQTAFTSFDTLTVGSTADTTTRPGYTITTVITNDMVQSVSGTPTVVLKQVTVTVTWIGTKQRQLAHRIATKLERRV